jgi:hypothetical protein
MLPVRVILYMCRFLWKSGKRGVDLAVEIINGKYDLNLPLANQEGIPNLDHAKIEVVSLWYC